MWCVTTSCPLSTGVHETAMEYILSKVVILVSGVFDVFHLIMIAKHDGSQWLHHLVIGVAR